MSRILVIDDDRGVTGVLKRGLTYGYGAETPWASMAGPAPAVVVVVVSCFEW